MTTKTRAKDMIRYIEDHLTLQQVSASATAALVKADEMEGIAQGENTSTAWVAYRSQRQEAQFWAAMEKRMSSARPDSRRPDSRGN